MARQVPLDEIENTFNAISYRVVGYTNLLGARASN